MPKVESTNIRQINEFEQSANALSAAAWTASEAVTTWTRPSESLQRNSPNHSNHNAGNILPYDSSDRPSHSFDQQLDKAAESLQRHYLRTEVLSLRLAHHMAHSSNVQDRREIASNPHCPKSVLAALSRDNDERVQALVAGNINTSAETLKHMAENKSDLVQTAIIRNQSTPDDVLANLGKHNKYAEIALKMRHKHIPEMIIDESDLFLSKN